MSADGLSSGSAFLVNAAKAFFVKTYQNAAIQTGTAFDKSVAWVPTLHFRVHDHLTVIAEVSENPYPLILNLRRGNLINLEMPVAVYSVCPEESYLGHQDRFKSLTADGFGMITVAGDGTVQRRTNAIPLIQQITDTEFAADIKGLPSKLRGYLAEAFSDYNHSPPSGAAKIAEIMEGLILRAGRDAAKKNWIRNADAKPGAPAQTLKAMLLSPQCASAAAAIGAAQAFIGMYRNTSHHFPKDRKQAAKKYRDCRHGFLEGLKKVSFFREEMKKLGLTGGL